MTELLIEPTSIPGLLLIRTPVHTDSRGWFKEGWQREKMVALGLPDFEPVQHNVAYNSRRGVTRGVHAEPWDKLVSLATGRVFGAWVDLREGSTFGTAFHAELDSSVSVFVPRGVGNAYQTLEEGTSYSYLTSRHWRADTAYSALDLADPTTAIPWPLPLDGAEISAKDLANPALTALEPMPPRRTLVTGGGQLATALAREFPDAESAARERLDVTDPEAVASWPWPDHDVVLNAAAFTKVDAAESASGRPAAWATNATGVARLAGAARGHGLVLVHYSSDYVFDGTKEEYDEAEPLAPLGIYGQSKAAGELAAATAPRHYVLRTSWLIGEGPNFVRTMAELALRGDAPAVVSDQVGRLTFTDELARATRHLLESRAPYGTYHVTGSGPPTSWHDVARAVFEACGRDPEDVRPVSTAEYVAGRPLAPRPANSMLGLDKLRSTGFVPREAQASLSDYLADYLRRVSAEIAGRTSTR